MKRPIGTVGAIGLGILLVNTSLQAQTKTIPGDEKVVTGTVEQIETSARTLTLKTTANEYEIVNVPPGVKGFDTVKVGDKLTLRYYDNIVLNFKRPGEPDVNTGGTVTLTPGPTGTSGTAAKQRTITATITEINMNVPSVTFTGPNNWKFSSKVQDKAALAKVKVGDKIDITWTEAVVAELNPAK